MLGLTGLHAGAVAAVPRTVGMVPFRAINAPVIEGFKAALREQGFIEGRDIQFEELPPTADLKQLEAALPELLARKPALLFVVTTPASQVVVRRAAPARVPVIFSPISDPVAAGLVPRLKRPGGGASGVRLSPTNGMRLALLLRAAPQARRIYLPYTRDDASALATLEQVRAVARELGAELLLRPLAADAPTTAATQQIPAEAQAIFLPQDSRLEASIDDFVAAARQRGLPLSAPSLWQVERGALISYGFDLHDCGRQAGRMAAQVLAGKDAGELPIETAQNRLWLNLRTARELGLELPEALLHQAQRIVR
jgi:putative ABC transport system substrate-binding protein